MATRTSAGLACIAIVLVDTGGDGGITGAAPHCGGPALACRLMPPVMSGEGAVAPLAVIGVPRKEIFLSVVRMPTVEPSGIASKARRQAAMRTIDCSCPCDQTGPSRDRACWIFSNVDDDSPAALASMS